MRRARMSSSTRDRDVAVSYDGGGGGARDEDVVEEEEAVAV